MMAAPDPVRVRPVFTIGYPGTALLRVGRAGMLTCVTAVSRRLPDDSLESLGRERVVDRTVDGVVRQDTYTERDVYAANA
jgi:hypothetical protein